MEQKKNNFKIITEKKNARVILPNMLTLMGVCIGLTSIRFALDEKYEFAIIAIIFAALIDGLDGRIARLIKGVKTKIPPAGDGTPSKKLSLHDGS